MAISPAFKEQLIELLSPLGDITIRAMFGGGGVYCDGLIFGLVINEVLYFKCDAASAGQFEAEGCGPFSYDTKDGQRSVMAYWQCPDRLYDEPDEMIEWARTALAFSRRAARDKAAPKTKAAVSGKPPKAAAGRAAKPKRSTRSSA